jgi:hypothetical protein
MGMRTFGIGAPATLLAQGVLEHGATVVLADFESPTDAELGDVVTRTLRIDLLQSRLIRVLDRADLGGALERMELERGTRITAAVATEMAEREGYGAIITACGAAAWARARTQRPRKGAAPRGMCAGSVSAWPQCPAWS